MNTVLKIIALFLFLTQYTLQAQDALKIEENGNVIVSQNLDVKGKIQQNGNELLPSGAIIMWYGGTEAPAGWVMCDGSLYTLKDGKYTKVLKENEAQYKDKNGTISTPDLRDRFVVGAGNKYSLNNKGGSAKVKLNINQIPEHDHNINLQTNDGGQHNHKIRAIDYTTSHEKGGQNHALLSMKYNYYGSPLWNDENTEISGSNHKHDISGKTDKAGSGNEVDILPPYYALYYIMKL